IRCAAHRGAAISPVCAPRDESVRLHHFEAYTISRRAGYLDARADEFIMKNIRATHEGVAKFMNCGELILFCLLGPRSEADAPICALQAAAWAGAGQPGRRIGRGPVTAVVTGAAAW